MYIDFIRFVKHIRIHAGNVITLWETKDNSIIFNSSILQLTFDNKIIINNFIDIFKSNILYFLKYKDEEYEETQKNNNITNIKEFDDNKSSYQYIYDNDHKQQQCDLENLDKNYIENICIIQADQENNKKVELYNKQEIYKIVIIKENIHSILISCLIFLFNNFINEHEKYNFFHFLTNLCIHNKINVDNNITNKYYNIQKGIWITISSYFNVMKKKIKINK